MWHVAIVKWEENENKCPCPEGGAAQKLQQARVQARLIPGAAVLVFLSVCTHLCRPSGQRLIF